MKLLKRGARIAKENAKYLLLGVGIFVVSVLLGYIYADALQHMVGELLKELDRIAQKIQHHGTALYTFWTIFKNNVIAAMSMIGLGVFFGFYPFVALVSNGILLGFMLKTFALKGVSPFLVLLLGILPHGIVEITAIIFAGSIGLRYGAAMFRLLTNFASSSRRSMIVEDFKHSLQDLPYIVGMVIVLLILAAALESTVTPWLIHHFLGDQVNLT